VEIINYTDTKASDRIQEVLEKGRSIGTTGKLGIQADQEDASLVNYILIDGSTRYLYEKNPVQDKEKIFVYEEPQPASAAVSDKIQAVVGDLPGGIGGKAVVKKNGSYVNATVRLATASQLTGAPSRATYTYMGFSGTGRKYDGSMNFGLRQHGKNKCLAIKSNNLKPNFPGLAFFFVKIREIQQKSSKHHVQVK
jgi:Domain of unknown function, YrpD